MSTPAWLTTIDADLAIALMRQDKRLECSTLLIAGGHGLSFRAADPKEDVKEDPPLERQFAPLPDPPGYKAGSWGTARATGIVAEYEPGISASPIQPSVRGCTPSFSRCAMVTLLALKKDKKSKKITFKNISPDLLYDLILWIFEYCDYNLGSETDTALTEALQATHGNFYIESEEDDETGYENFYKTRQAGKDALIRELKWFIEDERRYDKNNPLVIFKKNKLIKSNIKKLTLSIILNAYKIASKKRLLNNIKFIKNQIIKLQKELKKEQEKIKNFENME